MARNSSQLNLHTLVHMAIVEVLLRFNAIITKYDAMRSKETCRNKQFMAFSILPFNIIVEGIQKDAFPSSCSNSNTSTHSRSIDCLECDLGPERTERKPTFMANALCSKFVFFNHFNTLVRNHSGCYCSRTIKATARRLYPRAA